MTECQKLGSFIIVHIPTDLTGIHVDEKSYGELCKHIFILTPTTIIFSVNVHINFSEWVEWISLASYRDLLLFRIFSF